MNELAIFSSTSLNTSVRSLLVDGEPWFVAIDVAKALGYVDTDQAVRVNCKKAKSLKDLGVAIRHPQQNQEVSESAKIVPEPDLYRLILRSTLPTAEAFQDWVTEEVLPSLRKTGSYALSDATTQVKSLLDDNKQLRAWLDNAGERQDQLEQELHELMSEEVYTSVPERYCLASECSSFLARGIERDDYHAMALALKVRTIKVKRAQNFVACYHYEDVERARTAFLDGLELMELPTGQVVAYSPLLKRNIQLKNCQERNLLANRKKHSALLTPHLNEQS